MEQQNIIIYNTKDGKASVILMATDGNVWMSQAQLAQLFNTSKHKPSHYKHTKRESHSVVKDYLTTAADGKMV